MDPVSMLLLVNVNQYNSKYYFSVGLAQALQRRGVKVIFRRLAQRSLSQLDHVAVRHYRPTLTASMYTMEPLADGGQVCDLFQLPHWFIGVDSLYYYQDFLNHPLMIVSGIDEDDIALYGERAAVKPFALHHGVSVEECRWDRGADRPIDLLFLGSCYDFEGLRDYWMATLPPAQCALLDDAVERACCERRLPIVTLWRAALAASALSLDKGLERRLFAYYDYYIRGRDRVRLLRCFDNCSLHVYGAPFLSHPHASGWERYLGGLSHVTLHKGVAYAKAHELLRRSKICLNSAPTLRGGSHERVLLGMASGCAVISSWSHWLERHFRAGEELFFYDEADAALQETARQLLVCEERRLSLVENNYIKVISQHTWDQRAAAALRVLPGRLDDAIKHLAPG